MWPLVDAVDLSEPRDIPVEQQDLGLHTKCDRGGVET